MIQKLCGCEKAHIYAMRFCGKSFYDNSASDVGSEQGSEKTIKYFADSKLIV